MLPGSGLIVANSVVGTAVLMHGGPVTVTACRAVNTTAAVAYLQLFDSATAAGVTVGTTVPDWVVSSAANDASGNDGFPAGGIVFRNGVVVASTTTAVGATGASQHIRIAVV